MKAYRVARKPAGPWLNMTPPIRGGIYRKADNPLDASISDVDTEEEDTADDTSSTVSDQGSVDTDTSASSLDEKIEPISIIRRRLPTASREGPSAVSAAGHAQSTSATAGPAALSREEYTDQILQELVDQDLKDYPSLEPSVQQDIVRRYRVLHQRVHDEGFYDCAYIEYAKEMARYVAIFTTSMVALHYGWYMTSACFLGLFWVCRLHPVTCSQN